VAHSKLLIAYVLAIAVCAAIALFDRALIGLVGAGVCTLIFAVRFRTARAEKEAAPCQTSEAFGASETPVGAVGNNEHVAYGAPPLSYMPGNPGYRSPEGHD
jgi:hypothetical protein